MESEATAPEPKPAGPKRDLAGEAHFRIDDIERVLKSVADATRPEVLTALVTGAMTALHASVEERTSKIIEAQREDIDTDRAVVEKLEQLIATLKAPIQRTLTLKLPSGDVQVAVTETRLT